MFTIKCIITITSYFTCLALIIKIRHFYLFHEWAKQAQKAGEDILTEYARNQNDAFEEFGICTQEPNWNISKIALVNIIAIEFTDWVRL